MKTTAFLAIIFLVLSFTAANALAATNSFTRIFYYREGPRARESLLTYPSSIDVLAPRLDFPIFDRRIGGRHEVPPIGFVGGNPLRSARRCAPRGWPRRGSTSLAVCICICPTKRIFAIITM